jgi:hypothetical protein
MIQHVASRGEGKMVAEKGIRRIFMDLLYGTIIGSALRAVIPTTLDAKFWFSLFLIFMIMEDLFLYHGDVAPENKSSRGLSFFSMVTEVTILVFWFFCFQAFQADSWLFAIYLALFSFQKTLGGLLNCIVTGAVATIKFVRELAFLATAATALIIYFYHGGKNPDQMPMNLLFIGIVWAVQTVVWWFASLQFRVAQGDSLIKTDI